MAEIGDELPISSQEGREFTGPGNGLSAINTTPPDRIRNENVGIIENDSNDGDQMENADMDDEDEVARAAAQVSVMQEGNQDANTRRRGGGTRDTAAMTRGEEAMIGAPGEGVAGFEVIDRAGEMVRLRFQEFLNHL